MATIRFRRGANNNRLQLVPLDGEPVWANDVKKLFIGDGTTPGGVPVQPYVTSGTPAVGDLVTFEDTTGLKLKPLAKATLLAGYYTAAQVDAKDNAIKAGNVASATLAANASRFDGELPSAFVKATQITQSFSEANANKVPSAAALANAYNDLNGKINTSDTTLDTKVDKSSISSVTNSTSTTNVASSAAVKAAMDLAAQANTKGTQGISDASIAKNRADAAYTLASTAQTTATNAASAAQAARVAPDLPMEQKRYITYGTGIPSGGVEGQMYIQY